MQGLIATLSSILLCIHPHILTLVLPFFGSWQRSAYSINHSITIFGESCYFIAFPKKCGYALPGYLPSSWKRTILKKPDYCALLLNVHCSHLKKTNFYMDGRFEWKPHGLALLWKTDKLRQNPIKQYKQNWCWAGFASNLGVFCPF